MTLYDHRTSEQDLNQKKILLLNSDLDLSNYLENNLTQFNFIFSVGDQSGFDLALSYMPDLIIYKSQQNFKKTEAFYSNINSNPITSIIPVIAILDGDYQKNKSLIGQNGITDFIMNPLNCKELESRIEMNCCYLENHSTSYSDKVRTDWDNFSIFLFKIRQIIHSNLSNTSFSVQDLSNHFCISQRMLSKKIKGLTGLSLMEYINKIKIEIAAYLLLNLDFTISEVMYRVGFKSPSYFSKIFREYHELSPKEFLRENKG